MELEMCSNSSFLSIKCAWLELNKLSMNIGMDVLVRVLLKVPVRFSSLDNQMQKGICLCMGTRGALLIESQFDYNLNLNIHNCFIVFDIRPNDISVYSWNAQQPASLALAISATLVFN